MLFFSHYVFASEYLFHFELSSTSTSILVCWSKKTYQELTSRGASNFKSQPSFVQFVLHRILKIWSPFLFLFLFLFFFRMFRFGQRFIYVRHFWGTIDLIFLIVFSRGIFQTFYFIWQISRSDFEEQSSFEIKIDMIIILIFFVQVQEFFLKII